jgi:hypothetical protein
VGLPHIPLTPFEGGIDFGEEKIVLNKEMPFLKLNDSFLK